MTEQALTCNRSFRESKVDCADSPIPLSLLTSEDLWRTSARTEQFVRCRLRAPSVAKVRLHCLTHCGMNRGGNRRIIKMKNTEIANPDGNLEENTATIGGWKVKRLRVRSPRSGYFVDIL